MARPTGTTLKLSRWGNSLAVRIPKDTLDEIGVDDGDRLEAAIENGRLVLTPRGAPPSLGELLAGITPENLHVPEFEVLTRAEAW
jgi:antitoxin MazE